MKRSIEEVVVKDNRERPLQTYRNNTSDGQKTSQPRSSSNQNQKEKPTPKTTVPTKGLESNSSWKISNLGKCFICGQLVHLSNECPHQRTLAIQEQN